MRSDSGGHIIQDRYGTVYLPNGVPHPEGIRQFGPQSRVELTLRQRQVLVLLTRGLNVTEIATELILSHHTVKCYISRMIALTGARDRTHLMVWAYESGTLVPRYATHKRDAKQQGAKR